MKKIISLLMALLLMASLLCGCGGGEKTENAAEGGNQAVEMTDEKIKDKIVGAWVAEIDGNKEGYIFLEDGTGFASILPITYTVEKGMINIKIEAFGQTEIISAEYKVSGDTLKIEKDGKTVELTRTEMPEELK